MQQSKEDLKRFFETGDKPTQQQYADLIDSYVDAKQPKGKPNRKFIIDENGVVSLTTSDEISIKESSFSIRVYSKGSTFSYQHSLARKYKIGKRVFVDILLSGVTSDGNAQNNYIQITGMNEISSFFASGTVTTEKTQQVTGASIRSNSTGIRFKDQIWNDETLMISINFLGDGTTH
ncbi:hypothetical protein [Tenacibaculum sp. 190524A02b]|uniref:DUF5666 domain-containing protein n=1 Tax=Tenacibaculum vairaonense TaxID=3137860 RepID=A0ABP1FDV0_9FLAO